MNSTRAMMFAATALALVFLTIAPFDKGRSLAAAIDLNIGTTNAFYNELKLVVQAAKQSPESPIILEAYGSGAYEAVFSLSIYLEALGVKNRVSVRHHRDERPSGQLEENLQSTLSNLEKSGSSVFTPLRDNLTGGRQACISIGINDAPDAGCSGFKIITW